MSFITGSESFQEVLHLPTSSCLHLHPNHHMLRRKRRKEREKNKREDEMRNAYTSQFKGIIFFLKTRKEEVNNTHEEGIK